MASLIKFLGKLLFVSVLLTSAFLKIKEPNDQVALVTSDYNFIRNLHPTVTGILPSTPTVRIV